MGRASLRSPILLSGLAALVLAAPALAQTVSTNPPPAISADPAPDAKFPARLEVIHVPSGGVEINGIVLVASGPGPHPTVALFHGLPGNEKNLDLAQALRRAGWTVVAVNYRGSWGSPGQFRFAQTLEDAKATLAFIRDPKNAARYGFDLDRLAVVGHSMGGWVTAETLADDPGLIGAVVISPPDLGAMALAARSPQGRAQVVAYLDDSRETLAGVTGESMADEGAGHAEAWTFAAVAPKLKDRRLLVLYGDDMFRGGDERLLADIKAAGGTRVQSAHADTDHSWSDHRIALESLVINWLQSLPAKP